MNLLTRLRNLWHLSECDLLTPEKEKKLKISEKISEIIKKKKMAKILDISEIDLD